MEFDWDINDEKPLLRLEGNDYETLPWIDPNFRRFLLSTSVSYHLFIHRSLAETFSILSL